jgi:hypothetical protein
MVFDLGASSLSKMQYPSGQYVCSYYVETLLQHQKGMGLMFDTSVDDWKINARDMDELREYLEYQFRK